MNLEPYIRQLSILDTRLVVRKLEPNWAQLKYLRVVAQQFATLGRVRIIVLKARQIGISTITEALLFTLCMIFENYKALVIAHEIPASQNLLTMTERYWETYPFKNCYSTRYAGKNHLQWNENGSSVHVATAGNKAVGRSATIHAVHASEVAFWPEPSTTMLGLRQTIHEVPGTVIVLESTANGMGDFFHSTWLEAESGESEYQPLFFPWWEHPEYTASAIGLGGLTLTAEELDDDERKLVELMKAPPSARWNLFDPPDPYTDAEIMDRLIWRRWAIKNKCESDILKFKQEYPATPEEAFIASGTNVFPLEKLNACYHKEDGYRGYLVRNGQDITFAPSNEGPFTVFRGPSPDAEHGIYLVAGDPTHTTRGDYACAQVINRRTLEQVAVWRGRIDPGTFAEELFKIGLYYNTAIVTSEIEGPGYLTIGKLLGMNYPRIPNKSRPDSTPGKVSTEQYGWSTTVQSKHLAIGWLLKTLLDGSITIHDRQTYNEMRNYVTLDNGGYGNANGEENDDTVMALAIAVTSHMMEPPVPAYGTMSDLEDGSESLDPTLPWERWTDDQDEMELT